MAIRFRIIAAAVGVAVLLGLLSSCRSDGSLSFSKAPPRSAAKIDTKPLPSTVFASFPVDPAAALAAAEGALGDKSLRIVEWIANAACGRHGTQNECQSARIDGEIVRQGAIELTARDGRLMLKVPFKYTLAARGVGWAAQITDSKAGELTATVPVDGTLGAGLAFEVSQTAPPILSERGVALLKGQLDLARLLQPRLKAMGTAFVDSLKASLATQSVAPALQRSWEALQQPMTLSQAPELWLAVEPTRIGGLGFAQAGQQLAYKIAIGVTLAVQDSKPQPSPARARRLPEPVQIGADAHKTVVPLSVFIARDRLQSAVARAFPPKETLESRADRFTEAVLVSVRQADIHASQRLLSIELELDVKGPKPWAGRTGRLHLLARPAIDAAEGILTLDNVTMPMATAKDVREAKEPAAAHLRLGAEPFAQRLATAFKIDILRDVQNTLAQANAAVQRPAEDGAGLFGRFEAARVVAADPVAEGLLLRVNLIGELSVQVPAGTAEIAASGEQIPSQAHAGKGPKASPQRR